MKNYRKSKRFKEKRNDVNRQISVTFLEQFSPLKSFIGKLYDLSENAIKVIIEKQYELELLNYMPKSTLTKFRFSDNHKMTVSLSSIYRIDTAPDIPIDKIAIVLFFDVISNEDKGAIREIIELYA